MDKIDNKLIVLDNQDEVEINGHEEEQVYPMDGIKVDKGFYTVYELKRKFDSSNRRIILDSDFQRDDVWDDDRKAELVESVLMGLPLPIFYFNQDKYGRLIVVDGRQRLTALFDYIDDKFILKKLKILKKLNGLKFSQLSPVFASKLEDYQIQAHVILPPTPDRIKFDIFDRVNRGGMQLNKQEIRNALYQGKSTKFLSRIVGSQEFAEATGNAFVNEKRMKDKYLITRFVTFYLDNKNKIQDDFGNKYIYKDDIDDYLGRGMDTLNNMSDEEIEYLEKLIKELLCKSLFYLGENAFRIKKEGKRSPINMNVFETVMFALLWIPKEKMGIKVAVQKKVCDLLESEVFKENIGNHRDSALKLSWRLNQAEFIGRLFK